MIYLKWLKHILVEYPLVLLLNKSSDVDWNGLHKLNYGKYVLQDTAGILSRRQNLYCAVLNKAIETMFNNKIMI